MDLDVSAILESGHLHNYAQAGCVPRLVSPLMWPVLDRTFDVPSQVAHMPGVPSIGNWTGWTDGADSFHVNLAWVHCFDPRGRATYSHMGTVCGPMTRSLQNVYIYV